MKKSNRKQLIAYTNPNSPVSEQFKTIRTCIDFSSIDSNMQTILVTSPEPGSGKSTIAANLAIVYAQQGKKILLIDGDLRRPTVHKAFGKNMLCGLSSVLSNQIDLSEVCQTTDIENLSVLTSGAIPPNPNEMLNSNKMTAVLADLKQQYDFIIIDTPPVTIVSDALVISKNVDGIILVTRYGITLKDKIKQAIEVINITHVPVLGTVLNGVSDKKDNYYHHVYE
ncbi:CpsD/CapB family tyrosine-protein kinase [Listeria booriae]|uniref:CpsD/CapB family tyrosine-protein kinase n=1 Tax=Listeria booriae TaxID=1552123 RepID=UPI0016239F9C|nr:CpsD/CapB family tyrosine-protein kinase [Listeria booriae]MBC2370201.1 CpsD/CapB family tyrosine-protein kinase [Listeria booriae]